MAHERSVFATLLRNKALQTVY